MRQTKSFLFYSTLLLVTISGCKSMSQEIAGKDPNKIYPVITIDQRDTTLSIPYVADIQASRNVEIHSRIDGLLSKIFVTEGQPVKKGQLLFKINDSELKIELNKAEAAYKSAVADARVAEVEVERVKTLVEKGIIAHTELDLVSARHKALIAKTEVALADKNAVSQRIQYTSIIAPFDGIINRIPLKEGSLVNPSSLLTTLSDLNIVFAYFNLSESEFFQIQNGTNSTSNIVSINLVLPDGTQYPHQGELQPAESEIDGNTGNIAYKAKFKNPEGRLRHGASGKLIITRPLENAILLPQKSVFEIQDKNYVFVVGSDNIVQMKSIQVSQRLAEYYVVSDGIQVKDRIIYEGIQTVKEGDKIIPRSA